MLYSNINKKLDFTGSNNFNDEFSDFFDSPTKDTSVSCYSPVKGKKVSYQSSVKRENAPYQSPFKDKSVSKIAKNNLEIKEKETSELKRLRLTEVFDEDKKVNVLSDISNSFFESSLKSVPNTPRKKRRSEITNKFALKLLDVTRNSVHRVKTSLGNIQFEVKAWEQGTYSNVFHIISDQQIYPGYSNDQIVFSCFKPSIIEKDSNEVENYFDNKISQYRTLENLEDLRVQLEEKKSSEMLDDEEIKEIVEQLKKLSVPAFAKILNIETAKEDGFFIIEKIDQPFEVFFNADTEIDDFDEDDKNYLDQVKNAFAFAVEHNICLDYKKNNVGIRNGKVVLFDYMERDLSLLERLDTCVQTFAKHKLIPNQNIYDYLMPEGIAGRFCSKLVLNHDGNMSFKQKDHFS